MEIFLFVTGCFGWHLLVAALGAWLWAVKPWRVLRDYGEFRQWQQQGQQPRPAGRAYRPDDEVFAEVR